LVIHFEETEARNDCAGETTSNLTYSKNKVVRTVIKLAEVTPTDTARAPAMSVGQ
jgi:hypothetical protein